VFLLVFVGHTMQCFCWYLWGTLYIVSICIFGKHCVVFLLVFVGTICNNSASVNVHVSYVHCVVFMSGFVSHCT